MSLCRSHSSAPSARVSAVKRSRVARCHGVAGRQASQSRRAGQGSGPSPSLRMVPESPVRAQGNRSAVRLGFCGSSVTLNVKSGFRLHRRGHQRRSAVKPGRSEVAAPEPTSTATGRSGAGAVKRSPGSSTVWPVIGRARAASGAVTVNVTVSVAAHSALSVTVRVRIWVTSAAFIGHVGVISTCHRAVDRCRQASQSRRSQPHGVRPLPQPFRVRAAAAVTVTSGVTVSVSAAVHCPSPSG